ncbi:MAG TPA: transposase [Gaiellaceae bacterium]|nr:transposase [Gaiellaceae bacterium]
MAPLRIVDPTGIYHVMSRGNFRQTIFIDDDHYARYLFLVERVTARRNWIVLDWCLIPNHYHLLIQLTDDGLSDGMRELNGCFSRWSNAVRDRTGTGHLVRNRFACRHVTTDSHLANIVRYLALNPVAAALVQSPKEWPWSGYRALAGISHALRFHRPSELLRYLDPDPQLAMERYRTLVADSPVPQGLDPWSDHGYDVLRSGA